MLFRSPGRGAGPADRAALPTTTSSTAPGATTAPVLRLDGEPYVGVNDLARLLDATKYWRADVRKLVLRTRAHRLVLTVDNPFVVIDNATVHLPLPVRSLAGEVQVPIALVDSLPRDTTMARLLYGPGLVGIVRAPPGAGTLRSPQVVQTDSFSRVSFPIDRPEEATDRKSVV